MHTFFSSRRSGSFFIIKDEELKHLRVRRVKIGEKVKIIWEGSLYLCELEAVERKEAKLRILGKLKAEEPPVSVTLFQAVPVDLRTFEVIIQKATEIGVSSVVPLITERSFQKEEVLLKKRSRWEKIIREAMKQSGRPIPMEIMDPKTLDDIEAGEDLNLLLDNFSDGKRIRDLIMEGVRSVSLIVGPEGGFSEREVKKVREIGFVPVRLEPYTLRSETAAILGAGIIMNLAGL